jgi:hypothetical protein
MDDGGIVIRYLERQEIFLFSRASKPALGAPTSLLFNVYQELFSCGKTAVAWIITHTSKSYKFTNALSCTSPPTSFHEEVPN